MRNYGFELDALLFRSDETGWWRAGDREVQRVVEHNGEDIDREARRVGRRYTAVAWYSRETLTFSVPGLGQAPYAEYVTASRPWQPAMVRRRVSFTEAAHLLSQPVRLSRVHNGT